MSKLRFLAAGVTVLALGLAACGGSSSSSSAAGTSSSPAASSSSAAAPASSTATSSAAAAGGGGALSLAADPKGPLAFSAKTLSAKAGKVTIDFTNKAPEAHNLTIQQGTSGPVVGSTPTFNGASKMLTVNLKPGTYTFFCSVPGHRAGGMQGTLTVT